MPTEDIFVLSEKILLSMREKSEAPEIPILYIIDEEGENFEMKRKKSCYSYSCLNHFSPIYE